MGSGKRAQEEAVFEQVEGQVQASVEWLRLFVEALGALVIAAGVVVVVLALARHLLRERGSSFGPIRLSFARYLTLALELQLAADILSTSVAPTWDRITAIAASFQVHSPWRCRMKAPPSPLSRSMATRSQLR